MHVCAQVCISMVAQRHQMCHPLTLHLWLENGFLTEPEALLVARKRQPLSLS